MGMYEIVPQKTVESIIGDTHKILSDYTKAWKGNDSCPYEYTKDGTCLVVKDGDREYLVLVTLGAKIV